MPWSFSGSCMPLIFNVPSWGPVHLQRQGVWRSIGITRGLPLLVDVFSVHKAVFTTIKRLVVVSLNRHLGICPNEPSYAAGPHMLPLALNAPRLRPGVTEPGPHLHVFQGPASNLSSLLRCLRLPYCLTQGASLSSSFHLSFLKLQGSWQAILVSQTI